MVDEKDPWREKLEKLMNLPERQLINFFQQYQLKDISYHGKTYFYEVLQPTPLPAATVEPAITPAEKVEKKKGKKH